MPYEEVLMKKQLRMVDMEFIRDMIIEVSNSQNDTRRALMDNDLATFLQRLNLSDKLLTTLIDVLDKEIEYSKKDEELQGGK